MTDTIHHAETTSIHIESHGVNLLGVLHLPAGPGPHPTIVLLHGFPGWERNFDLAHRLRESGFATLVFHYRGAWGSPGAWTWWSGVEDALVVVRRVLDGSLHPRLDADRCMVAGHSFGGFIALQVASQISQIRAAATFACFDLGVVRRAVVADASARHLFESDWAGELAPLSGTTADQLVDEVLIDDYPWELRTLAESLSRIPVLMIGTNGRDPVTPATLHHDPLVKNFRGAHVDVQHDVFETDHALSDQRARLATRLSDFFTQVG